MLNSELQKALDKINFQSQKDIESFERSIRINYDKNTNRHSDFDIQGDKVYIKPIPVFDPIVQGDPAKSQFKEGQVLTFNEFAEWLMKSRLMDFLYSIDKDLGTLKRDGKWIQFVEYTNEQLQRPFEIIRKNYPKTKGVIYEINKRLIKTKPKINPILAGFQDDKISAFCDQLIKDGFVYNDKSHRPSLETAMVYFFRYGTRPKKKFEWIGMKGSILYLQKLLRDEIYQVITKGESGKKSTVPYIKNVLKKGFFLKNDSLELRNSTRVMKIREKLEYAVQKLN